MKLEFSRHHERKSALSRAMTAVIPITLLSTATLWIGATPPVGAEGSREMVSDGGDRPFTEWANGTTAGIPRRTLLQVYVRAGETINLGSSVHDSANNPNDIVYRTPSDQVGSCNVRSNNGFGWIDTIAKETAGPRPNPNGYRPCTVAATETGIYEVEFHAPSTTGNPPTTSATAAFPTGSSQNSGVAAWDITVRDAAGNDQTGRVFTSYLAMNMGGNNQSLASDFYIQTWDGYLYRTDMNNVDPYGFIFFGNSRGFLDTNGSALYHSAKATNNSLSPFQGNVIVQSPLAANNPATNDYTHLVFFNPPKGITLDALGIPRSPMAPQPPADFRFEGADRSDNRTLVGAGGYFEFTVASGSSYRIILDTNADAVFDVTTDRVLENTLVAGVNRVYWDGKDASGNDLQPRPGNVPYDAQIVIRSGEYHFPMLDAESNTNGFIIEMVNPPQGFPNFLDVNGAAIDRYTVYYNDSNYVTANGTLVDLDGGGATSPRNASQGINSSGGEHEFTSRYGDYLGIDTWAFFPSEAAISNVIVTNEFNAPGLLLVKRITAINGVSLTDEVDGVNSVGDPNHVGTPQDQDDDHAHWPSGLLQGRIRENLQPGDQVEFTIYFLSSGEAVAQNALFCDLVPSNVTFLPAAYAAIAAASGPNPAPGVTTDGGDRGMVLGLGTQSSTTPYPIVVSLSNSSDGDVGQYVAPGVDLTTIDARLSTCGSNTNGAIVVNLGDLPPATSAGDPPGSYGLLRFQGQVN